MVEALTVERARELFAGLLPAPGPVRAVSRFAEGSVTGAYRIEFAGADPAPVVLKIYDAGSLRFAVKEARALRFLTAHGLDISPRVLAFSRSAGALGDRPCLVCALRPGRTLADLGAELTGAQRREVYRQLGAVLKRLHAIPPAATATSTARSATRCRTTRCTCPACSNATCAGSAATPPTRP